MTSTAPGPLLSSILVGLQGAVLVVTTVALVATGSASLGVLVLLAVGAGLLVAAIRLHRGSPGARALVISYEVLQLVLCLLALLVGQVLLVWGLVVSAVVLAQLLRRPPPR